MMRERFEKLPEIAELVDQFDFSEDTNTYHIRYDDMDNDRKRLDVMYLGGAWHTFQEVHKELKVQQKIINNALEHIKEYWIDDDADYDVYLQLIEDALKGWEK